MTRTYCSCDKVTIIRVSVLAGFGNARSDMLDGFGTALPDESCAVQNREEVIVGGVAKFKNSGTGIGDIVRL